MSLCSALKRVGCFDTNRDEFEPRANNDYVKRNCELFENIFTSQDDSFSPKNLAEFTQVSPSSNYETNSLLTYASPSVKDSSAKSHGYQQTSINTALVYACYILRYLYETALDTFDK